MSLAALLILHYGNLLLGSLLSLCDLLIDGHLTLQVLLEVGGFVKQETYMWLFNNNKDTY